MEIVFFYVLFDSYFWVLIIGWLNSFKVIVVGFVLVIGFGVVVGVVCGGNNCLLCSLVGGYVVLIC